MEAKELRAMSVAQLGAKETELRSSLARLTMKRNARRLDRTSDLEATKRDLARVLTILGEKRSAGGEGDKHGRG
jgi:large subunit ribosomal protein L29